jgi:redox-sensitive bicupin YhaK (pirin superfamily)
MIHPGFVRDVPFQYYPAGAFPTVAPAPWLRSHFAVGGWSPLSRLSGMLTAHMTQIAPHRGFTWHPHRGLEIYTWVLDGTLSHEDTTGGKGDIRAGDLQRMFSGEYIEHKEMNHQAEPARVIQIWFAADPVHRGVEPHYQQISGSDLPKQQVGGATVTQLIGGGSPMRQHMHGRLTETTLPAGAHTTLLAPHKGEDLFVYVTGGAGGFQNGQRGELGLYDVMLARPNMGTVIITAAQELHYLSFYLPSFIGQPGPAR